MSITGSGMRARVASLADASNRLKSSTGLETKIPSLVFFSGSGRGPSVEHDARAGGARVSIIVRGYQATNPRKTISQARTIRAAGAGLIIAGDLDLAKQLSADGLHWPVWRGTPPPQATRGTLFLTVPCHTADELNYAVAHGADGVFLSPVFATRSHPHGQVLGPAQFRDLAATSPVPVLGLGGMDATNAPLLRTRNVIGFGAIDAFAGNTDENEK